VKFISVLSSNPGESLAATNRVLSRTSAWTDEDWGVLCRAEKRGKMKPLLQMLGAELCDEVPQEYLPVEWGDWPNKDLKHMRRQKPAVKLIRLFGLEYWQQA
jgi:hypothetical protein